MNRLKNGVARPRVSAALSLLMVFVFAGSAALAADLSLSASNNNLDLGDTFKVTVNLKNAPPFANWAEVLRFDNTKVELMAQATGSFSIFIPDSRSLTDANASGEVRAAGFGFSDNAGGNGSLGIFTFKAIGAGSTAITTVNKSGTEPFGNMLQPVAGGEVLPTIAGPLNLAIGATPPPPEHDLTITTTGSGNGTVSLDPPGGAYAEGTVVTLTANPASGSLFVSWSGDLSGSANPTTLTINENKQVTATFNSAPPPPQPTVALVGSTTTPNVGDTFTVTVNLAGAAPFANWAELLRFDNTKIELASQAAGSFSTFIPDSRSVLEVNASGEIRAAGFGFSDNAGGNGSLGVFTFKAIGVGSTAITAVNKSGSEPFGNVLQPLAGGEVLPLNAGPLGLTIGAAPPPPEHDLTITTTGSGNGTVSLDPPGGAYAEGTVVTLTANPASGSLFVSWSGDLSGSANPTTLTINENKQVTATFNSAPPPPQPTISLVGSTTTPNVGDTFTVTINLAGAAPFANWAELLRFDNTKMELASQAAGSFSTFIPDSRSLSEVSASGEVRAAGFGFSDNSGGNGSLGVFTFKAIGVGSTTITAVNKSGSEPFGNVLQPLAGGEVLPLNAGPLGLTIGGGSSNSLPVIDSGPTATPNPLEINQTVTFFVSALDPDGDVVSYAWNFGDGSTGTGPFPSHAYAAAGSYEAVVNVDDGKGGVVSASVTVVVNGSASQPTISLAGSTTAPDVGSSFTVTVNLGDALPFANWAELLRFDNTKVELTDQAAGGFSTFIPDSRSLAEINGSGEVRAAGFGFSDNAGGSGSLGVFTFKAISAGSTAITTVNKSGSVPFGNVLQPVAGGEVLPVISGPLNVLIGNSSLPGAPVIDLPPLALPSPALVGEEITFFVPAHDPDGDLLTYSWDFGDGTGDVGVVVKHKYQNPNTFAAIVYVSDGTHVVSALVNVTVTVAENHPPVIELSPLALPNPITLGETMTLFVGACDPDGDSLSYTWSFGDGTGASGMSVKHVYSAGGEFTATVTVSDGKASVTAAVKINVIIPGVASEPTPKPELAGTETLSPLTIRMFRAKTNFARTGRDSAQIVGEIKLPAGFDPSGVAVALDVGGVTANFTLDRRGRDRGANGMIRMKLKRKRNASVKDTTVLFKAVLRKGSFATTWAGKGLRNADMKKEPVSMPLTMKIGGKVFAGNVAALYTAKQGKRGTAVARRR